MAKGESYEQFVEKFKPKKTTDDCMTPPLIYETVKEWACERYGIDEKNIVRPFWPGLNFEEFEYPDGCVVLDNPPFSILSKICAFYLEHGIPFFLFAPSLTALSGRNTVMKMNHIFCDADIVYENGAIVNTAFVTSFGGDIVAQTAPDLTRRLDAASKMLRDEKTKTMPRYMYPDHVITAAMLKKYSHYGIPLSIKRGECTPIAALDAQKAQRKGIFGGGLLVSTEKSKEKAAADNAVKEKAAADNAVREKAAKEKAAADRQKTIVWALSPREKQLIERMCEK